MNEAQAMLSIQEAFHSASCFLKRYRYGILLLLVVLVGSSLATWAQFRKMALPADPGSNVHVKFEVQPGATAASVAQKLQESGLIRSASYFRWLSKNQNLDRKLQAGEFLLSPSMTPLEVLNKLVSGDVITYAFTIPEGATARDIALILDQNGFVRADEFLTVAQSGWPEFEFLPKRDDLIQPLEGYLFPNTYRVAKPFSSRKIIELMLTEFKREFKPEFLARAEELGMTVHEVITLASIIEKEAQLSEERPLISSVFHNRLKRNMRLDADPSVKYVMQNPPEVLTYKDIEVNSPYNTYKYPGLPPGPISNPGIESIKAALYPAETDYLYFVAKNDGSHVFSRTYEEHLAAKRKYQGTRN